MSTTKEKPLWRVWLVPKGYRIRSENDDVYETDWVQICGAHFIPFGLAQENFDKWRVKKNKSGLPVKIRNKYVIGEFFVNSDAVRFAEKYAKENGHGIDKY